MHSTDIEWTDLVWNPVHGCTRLCENNGRIYCFAYWMAQRLKGRYGYDPDEPFRPTLRPDRLDEPYRRRKPAKIFTCDMGDLFDPCIPRDFIERIFDVMNDCSHLTFQVLTKRYYDLCAHDYPENLWLGVSQDGLTTDPDLIRALLATYAKVKFVSFEPLLGPKPDVDLYGLDWIIIGAQTGARKVAPEAKSVQDIIDEADDLRIPVFLKHNLQWPEFRQEWPKGVVG